MKKDIERLRSKIVDYLTIEGSGFDVEGYEILNLINQLDEPELPVIPQFVADWYENHRDNLEKQLQGIAYNLDRYGRMPEVSDLDKWINETEYPLQILASLRLGYEVEEEQKYVVKTNLGTYLIIDTSKREWDYTSIPPQDDDIQYAYRFDDRRVAEGIAKLVEGKVKVWEE